MYMQPACRSQNTPSVQVALFGRIALYNMASSVSARSTDTRSPCGRAMTAGHRPSTDRALRQTVSGVGRRRRVLGKSTLSGGEIIAPGWSVASRRTPPDDRPPCSDHPGQRRRASTPPRAGVTAAVSTWTRNSADDTRPPTRTADSQLTPCPTPHSDAISSGVARSPLA